jgi:hypothetical protein
MRPRGNFVDMVMIYCTWAIAFTTITSCVCHEREFHRDDDILKMIEVYSCLGWYILLNQWSLFGSQYICFDQTRFGHQRENSKWRPPEEHHDPKTFSGKQLTKRYSLKETLGASRKRKDGSTQKKIQTVSMGSCGGLQPWIISLVKDGLNFV